MTSAKTMAFISGYNPFLPGMGRKQEGGER